MNKKILALALSLIIATAFVSAQSVYKWTDEEGVTHFGDRQPIGQQSESISIRTGRQSSSDRASPQERVRQINEQQAEAAESEAMTAAEEARQKQRSANCQTATSNLSLISSGSRIKVQEDGEERFLTDEEIAEKREQFEDIAEANCGN